MTKNMKPDSDINEAMLALREDYEHTAPTLEGQPEPRKGKEIKTRRFPKLISYLMGAVAVMMLVTAIFMFTTQAGQTETESVADLADLKVVETAVIPEIEAMIIPTPPLLEAPPLPEETILLPPEPTPWPTPPIDLDSP